MKIGPSFCGSYRKNKWSTFLRHGVVVTV